MICTFAAGCPLPGKGTSPPLLQACDPPPDHRQIAAIAAEADILREIEQYEKYGTWAPAAAPKPPKPKRPRHPVMAHALPGCVWRHRFPKHPIDLPEWVEWGEFVSAKGHAREKQKNKNKTGNGGMI